MCNIVMHCTYMYNVHLLNLQDEGVTFVINGQAYTFRGTLALVSGDNLASHYLGGYKSLSSALRKMPPLYGCRR